MHWLQATTATAYYVTLPVLLLWQLVVFLLYWLLFPFLFAGSVVKEVMLVPLRFLAQFEALWYYLLAAISVGLVFGGGAHAILRIFVVVFGLDRRSIPMSIPPTGHDAASYRAARAEKKLQAQEKQERQAMRVQLLASQPLLQEVVREARSRPLPLTQSVPANTGTPATRSGLLHDIILEQTEEEEESDF